MNIIQSDTKYKLLVIVIIFFVGMTSATIYKNYKQNNTDKKTAENRPFYMAFTPFPYDYSLKAVETTNTMISDSSDAVLVPFSKGIPWKDSLAGNPITPQVENQIKNTVDKLPSKNKIILSVSPMNEEKNGVAYDWSTEVGFENRSGEFKDVKFSDEKVITAYSNFCNALIARCKPKYFIYSVDINMLIKYDIVSWKDFKLMCENVYGNIKKKNPDLPVMFSIQLDSYFKSALVQREKLMEVVKFTDYICVSAIPYAFSGYYDPASIPTDYFTEIRKLSPSKPFAISQTGFLAEDLSWNEITIKGNDLFQQQYTNYILKEADKEKASFVCWYIIRDYDKLLESNIDTKNANFSLKLWRDTGLIDEDGNFRKSYKVWMEWFEKKRTILN